MFDKESIEKIYKEYKYELKQDKALFFRDFRTYNIASVVKEHLLDILMNETEDYIKEVKVLGGQVHIVDNVSDDGWVEVDAIYFDGKNRFTADVDSCYLSHLTLDCKKMRVRENNLRQSYFEL